MVNSNLTTMKTSIFRIFIATLCASAVLVASRSQAQALVERKLLPANTNPLSLGFGFINTMNQRWIVCSAPLSGPQEFRGTVQVFDAAGNRRRVLRSPRGGSGDTGFGFSLALLGDQLLVGAPKEAGKNPMLEDAGAAYLIGLTTGQIIRRFTAPDGKKEDVFGKAVALSRDYVVISASCVDGDASMKDVGAVYVFSRRTGEQLFKLTPPDGAAADFFGSSMALEGGLLAVGSRKNGDGRVYVFDLASGQYVKQFGSLQGDEIGSTVAMSGRFLLAGAPGADDLAVDGGAAVVFDLITGLQVRRLTAPASDAFDGHGFGHFVALQGNLALVSAINDGEKGFNHGAAYLMDIRDGKVVSKWISQSAKPHMLFGTTPVLLGGRALIGAPYDSTAGFYAGAAYLRSDAAVTYPWQVLASADTAATGVLGAFYNRFDEVFIDGQSNTVATGRLSGDGAQGGKNRGVWKFSNTNQVALSLVSGVELAPKFPDFAQLFTGVRATGFSGVSCNKPANRVFLASLAGPGVNSSNNRAIFADKAGQFEFLYKLGMVHSQLGGGVIQRFNQIVQSRTEAVAVFTRVRVGTGTSPVVTAADDTAICIAGNGGKSVAIREGKLSSANNLPFGEIVRGAYQNEHVAFTAGIIGDPAKSQGVFAAVAANSNSSGLYARRGDNAPGGNGAQYATFTGENISMREKALIRATLRGSGVNAGNRVGLWSDRASFNGNLQLEIRAGDPLPGLPPGVVLRNVLRYWIIKGTVKGVDGFFDETDRVVLLASLRGPGVNAGNNTALFVHDGVGVRQLLMREGDPAPGCQNARLGSLSRITVDPVNGWYAVLVPLRGAPAGSNLALYTGLSCGVPANHFMRRPFLTLRKGQLFVPVAGATPQRLRSIRLSVPDDGSGAGAKGLGQPINQHGTVVLTIDLGGQAQIVRLTQS